MMARANLQWELLMDGLEWREKPNHGAESEREHVSKLKQMTKSSIWTLDDYRSVEVTIKFYHTQKNRPADLDEKWEKLFENSEHEAETTVLEKKEKNGPMARAIKKA